MSTEFDVTVRIEATRERVEAALVDPAFYPTLGQLPAVSDPRVLHHERDGDRVLLRVHYRFTAALPGPARRVVDPDRLTWVDETELDLSSHRAVFRIVPDHYADRLHAHGGYELVADGDATLQRVSGEVLVRVRLVGSLAERGIVRGLRENVEHEARLLERWIASRT